MPDNNVRDTRTTVQRIVSQYKGVFTEPPVDVPTDKVVDGPIMGNGDVGVVISGGPEMQRFWISKCDFWKARRGHDSGSPCLLGGIDISIPQLADATYHIEQLIYGPEIKSSFSTAGTAVNMHSWVAALENLLVIELSATGKPVSVAVNLWAQTGHESTTEQGTSKDVYWVTRKFNGTDLAWSSEAAIAMRCLGVGVNMFTMEAGQTIMLIASIITNHNAESYLKDSQKRIYQLDLKALESIRIEHLRWWQDFWSASFLEIGDPLIEKFYYGSQYIMACCSRNKSFPPGLFGNWITTDKPAWAGDYHLNYNYQAPWWGVYSSNHVELSAPYDAPLLDFIPEGKEYAKRCLNCRGVYYPVGIGPKGLDTTVFPGGYGLFLGQKSDAVFAAANMFLRFYHTYDLEYAKKVYPYLIEVADFWEDYLKFEPFDGFDKLTADKLGPGNGRYVIYKDNVWEIDSWNKQGREESYETDMNPTLSLGMVRMFFKGMLEISKELDIDAARHEKWRHILTHISEFPMVVKDGRKRFCAAERGPSAKVIGAGTVMLQGLVWPSGVFGLDSDPELLQNLRNDVKTWFEGNWQECGNSFPTMFPVAARLGCNPGNILANLRKKIQTSGFPNLWIFQGGGGIETCAGVTACINEMLLQSHENVLRLFPVWPKEINARFGLLRAVGAFLVTSALRDGRVQYVLIESEKGRDCPVENPWPDKEVTVYRNGGKTEILTGARFTIKTVRGEWIALGPKGASPDELQHLLI